MGRHAATGQAKRATREPHYRAWKDPKADRNPWHAVVSGLDHGGGYATEREALADARQNYETEQIGDLIQRAVRGILPEVRQQFPWVFKHQPKAVRELLEDLHQPIPRWLQRQYAALGRMGAE